jgi:hypothetical protein
MAFEIGPQPACDDLDRGAPRASSEHLDIVSDEP